jgi:hypothetical protein
VEESGLGIEFQGARDLPVCNTALWSKAIRFHEFTNMQSSVTDAVMLLDDACWLGIREPP